MSTESLLEHATQILDDHDRLSRVSPSADLDALAWRIDERHYIAWDEASAASFDLIRRVDEEDLIQYDELRCFADVHAVVAYIESEHPQTIGQSRS